MEAANMLLQEVFSRSLRDRRRRMIQVAWGHLLHHSDSTSAEAIDGRGAGRSPPTCSLISCLRASRT